MATQGGPAIKVSVQTSGQRQGGPALPVAVVTDGRAVAGGPAIAGYIVTSGPVQGGPALPVVAAAAGAQVAGGPAIPLYVVSGSFGATVAPPVNTGLPTISGTLAPGQTLTATTGTWSNSPTSYSYQWNQNGGAIGGATSSTYVVQAGDAGTTLTCTVTATNAGGSTSASSAGVAISSLHSSLVAYWALEEASGTRADATGRGNTLSPSGSPLPGNTTGVVGNAISITAANNQYVSIVSNADVTMGDIDFTIAFWFRTPNANTQAVVTKWNTTGNQREWWCGTLSGPSMNLYVSNDGSANSNASRPYTANAWHFAVGWHDSVANTLNLTIDDGAVGSIAWTTGVLSGTSSLIIGRDNNGNQYEGRVDEVGIWKRVLTSAERTKLYNSGNGRTWPFVGA